MILINFLWRENEEYMFPLADKTNNEHVPKPFFKVTEKSLYYIKCNNILTNFLFVE